MLGVVAMSLRRVCDLFTSALAWEGADVGCFESGVILGGNESVAAVIILWVIVSERVLMSCGVVGRVSGMLVMKKGFVMVINHDLVEETTITIVMITS